MHIRVLGPEPLVRELLAKPGSASHSWMTGENPEVLEAPDLLIDLEPLYRPGRTDAYSFLGQVPVLIHGVHTPIYRMLEGLTYSAVPRPWYGWNAWPGFISRPLAELSLGPGAPPGLLRELMEELGWSYRLVEDRLGMVSPRILAQIINEAYLALGEGTASAGDIDRSMELGTRYPMGPFAWCQKIGAGLVCRLLEDLHRDQGDERYRVAPLLLLQSRGKEPGN